MKSETYSATISEYQGRKLDEPIKYTVDYDAFENITEAKDSEQWLSDAEVLREVNKKVFTAAKAKEYQKVTKTLKEDWENSDEYKRKKFIDAAIALGKSTAEAEALAESLM